MSADPLILEKRIEKRVNEMIINMNGLQEIVDLFKMFDDNNQSIDFSKGIL